MEALSISILTFVVAGFVLSLVSNIHQFYTAKNTTFKNLTKTDIDLLVQAVEEVLNKNLAGDVKVEGDNG